MALIPICAQLSSGLDASCTPPVKRYFQQAVVINKTDIESYDIVKTNATTDAACQYHVKFTLKTGKTGYLFRGSEIGSNYFGNFDKSQADSGYTQYLHRVQMLVVGVDESAKCVLDSLDKGNYVVAMQFNNNIVEIYGIDNGISTGDYTYDPQANGGATAIQLQSRDNALENNLPMVYKSGVEGGETADFDSLFANAAA